MPAFVLNSRQIWTLVRMAGLKEPVKGSPLYFLPEKHELHPDDPAFSDLLENHLIETEGSAQRVNKLFAFALETCVRPEEVISVGVGKAEYPGYAVARKAAFWCECTTNREGITKFSFPLSRSTVLMSLTGAFSSKSPEPELNGFRFVGQPEEAFVLVVALKELREYPVGLNRNSLKKAVAKAASTPLIAAPFALSTAAGAIERLGKSGMAIEEIINKLTLAGHLRTSGDKLLPSESAKLALGSFPVASFGISRTEISDSGSASETMQVLKVGDRKLVFRMHNNKQTAAYEWVEMNRQQIRLMINAMFMPSQMLAKNIAKLPVTVRTGRFAPVKPAKPINAAPAAPTANSSPITGPGLCQSCGAKLPAGALFCGQCGTVVKKPAVAAAPVTVTKPVPVTQPAVVYCRKCGTPLGEQAAFCKKCGASRR